jgi:predicted Zn-dependent protease
MKFRLVLVTLAVFGFFAVATSAFPDDKTSPKPTDTTVSTAPQQTPSATPAADSDKDKADAEDASKPAPVIQAADPDKVKHDGGKDDVDAIGNRNVGCNRGLSNWYSVEGQIAMGKQYAQQVEATSKIINDPVIAEYVNRVGQNIVRNSDSQVPFTIKVVDSDEINAFALPGGFFYVNSGLILAADEEAELAGVMAHEIAHVAACHAARQQTRGNFAQIASVPLIFIGGWAGYGAYQAASVGIPVTFMKFQRGFEAEADYLGLQYMYKSGYDPNAYITFFEKIQAQEKRKPGTLAKVFSDHPQTPDRIEKSQEEIATILPARPQYLVTTSEFDEVKARLAALENRRKMVDDKDSKKPTLRRTSNTNKNGKNGDSGDDRPTLKHRPD